MRDPAGVVPKGVPPDKSAGACPSVQENTTGKGNVGKSPCGGTNAENQSLQAQENPREYSVALTAWNQALTAWEQAITLHTVFGTEMKAAMSAWSPEVDPKEQLDAYMKSNGNVFSSSLACIESTISLMEVLDELPPEKNICMMGRLKGQLGLFMSNLKSDVINYKVTQTLAPYQQLLSKVQVLDERESADKKAVDVKKAEEAKEIDTKKAEQQVSEEIAKQKKAEVAATAAAQKLTEEHRVLAQQQAEERAIAEKRAAGKQKAEEAFAKASAKAAAGKKVEEEKAARAAYEVDRKKKAVEKADAKRNAAKQADEAAKTNAAERLNAYEC